VLYDTIVTIIGEAPEGFEVLTYIGSLILGIYTIVFVYRLIFTFVQFFGGRS